MTMVAPPRPASPPATTRQAGPPHALGCAWLLLAALLAIAGVLYAPLLRRGAR